jgi:hypothetical protein
MFERYIGIDYSGAKTPTSSLSGLRVYIAGHETAPTEVLPPPSARKYWTRHGVGEWLVEQLREQQPSLVGIDHGFSFPIQYFDKYSLPHNWPAFLDDFQEHWPTDQDDTYVQYVRDGVCGKGNERAGDPLWFRLTDLWTPSAKSVFRFDVQGSVANSTHAGLPWLRYIRRQGSERVHFWPFDGWQIPAGRSVLAEVYPSLWMRRFPNDAYRTADQHAAYSVAAWMRRSDLDTTLARFFNPGLTPDERKIAQSEGWILGVI